MPKLAMFISMRRILTSTPLKWLIALVAVFCMYETAYKRGELNGEMGVGYWNGWKDAMIQTDFGKKPYNSEESLLK